MKRVIALITAVALMAPISGAFAGAEDGGDDVAYFDASRGKWTFGTKTFYFGSPGDVPLICDWDGDGVPTVGVYRDRTGYLLLRNSNTTGSADYELFYGIKGDKPICGDWDGDGIETIGVFRPKEGKFYLRNSNTQGFADIDFHFGFKHGEPFVGDWDGDGVDTVGIRDVDTGYIATAREHANTAPAAEGYLGGEGVDFLVGDWNGDGKDSIGYYRETTRTLSIASSPDNPSVTEIFNLDARGEKALVADFQPNTGVTTSLQVWDPDTVRFDAGSANGQGQGNGSGKTPPGQDKQTTTTTAPSPTTTVASPEPTTTTTVAPAPTTTTTVATAPPPANSGQAWGVFTWPLDTHYQNIKNLGQYNAVHLQLPPWEIDSKFAQFQRDGMKVVLQLCTTSSFRYPEGSTAGPGGSRLNVGAWKQNCVDPYVAAGVDFDYWTAQGVLIGAYLMDEPHASNSWGNPIPGPTIDNDLAGTFEAHWPNTLTYVRVAPTQLPNMVYQHLDGAWSQWSWAKGFSYGPRQYHGVEWWISQQLAGATARGLSHENLIWGIAVQHGGIPNDVDQALHADGLPRYSESTWSGSSQGGSYMRPAEIDLVAPLVKAAPGKATFVFAYEPNDWYSVPTGWALYDQWHAALARAAG